MSGETATAASTRPAAGRSPNPRLILVACCFSLFMAQLDATAVNVAMPSISGSLGGGISGLQWVVDGYVLALACLGMSGGSLGDRYGRRRTYRIGLVVFSLSSLGCGLAPDLAGLVTLRIVQGVGAAMLMPVTLSIITNTFHDPAARARAIGVWAGVAGLAAGVGPMVGGALASGLGWRAIFWINLPIGALAYALAGRHIPESRSTDPGSFDLTGQVLLAATLAALTYALIEAPAKGWGSSTTLGLLGGAGIGGLCFVVVETRIRRPLIEPRYFRDRGFAGAGAIACLAYLAVMGFLFMNSLYLQRVRGLSPLTAGLAMLPASLTLAAASLLAGRLVARYGPRPVLIASTCSLVAAMAVLIRATPTTAPVLLLAAYLLLGAGWGLLNPPLTNVAIAAMPRDRAGVASASVGVSRQLGAVLGVAIMGSLTTTRTSALIRGGRAEASAFTEATHLGYAVGIGAALVGLVIAIATMPRNAAAGGTDLPHERQGSNPGWRPGSTDGLMRGGRAPGSISDMRNTDVVTVRGLRKAYGNRVVVDDLDLDVPAGEIVGLVGANGAGKTTTVECLQGLRKPDAGTLRVLGFDPVTQATDLRPHVGSQLQDSGLPDRLRVAEAVKLFRTPHGWDGAELLEQFGLAARRRSAFASLSGGERQRLFLVLALLNRPRLVILDELTQGLDPAARRDVWAAIRQLNEDGTTVLLVTHEMDEAESLCNQVLVMRAGQLVDAGTPAELVDRHAAEATVRFSLQDYPPPFLDSLRRIDGVRSVDRTGARVVVRGERRIVAHVCAAMVACASVPADLQIHTPTLEDALLGLLSGQTGEATEAAHLEGARS